MYYTYYYASAFLILSIIYYSTNWLKVHKYIALETKSIVALWLFNNEQ
jgi:hypothetical protein